MDRFEFSPIGYVQSPFKDKFGIPRQPGIADKTQGVIKLNPDPDLKIALRRLDEFSHIWIIFVFHDHGGNKWKPSIRPPRLGGQVKVGLFSSRSPHRPNPIGISAVRLEKINFDVPDGPEILVQGIDLLDQTPVLDIKPYIPYADSIPQAHPGWAHETIKKYPVVFSTQAENDLRNIEENQRKKLQDMIIQIIELDPRPAFKKRQNPAESSNTWGQKYGLEILGYEVKYTIQNGVFDIDTIFLK